MVRNLERKQDDLLPLQFVNFCTQGISEPSLRYIACRVAQEVCTLLGDRVKEFRTPLFLRYSGWAGGGRRCIILTQLQLLTVAIMCRLQSWYKEWKEQYNSGELSEDKKYHFINLALFYAEVFVRVQVVSNIFKEYH